MSKGEKIEAKIEIIEKSREIDGPVLVDFHGRLPQDVTFQAYSIKNPIQGNLKYPKYILRGQSEGMVYQATSRDDDDDAHEYLLGVLNKKEKKLKLIPVKQMDTQQRPINLLNLSGPDGDKKGNKTELSQAFGTRKMKSAIANREKNIIDVTKIQNAAGSIKTAIETKAGPDSNEVNKESSGFVDALPYHDMQTTRPDLIYPLGRMVDIDLLKLINLDPIDEMSMGEYKNVNFAHKSGFLRYRILKILNDQTKYDKESLRYALYAMYLSVVYKINTSEKIEDTLALLKKFDGCIIQPPTQLLQYILDNFFQKIMDFDGKYKNTITKRSKMKIMIHCLILYLHLNEFQLPLDEFASEFDLKLAVAKTLVNGVGCKVTPKTNAPKSDSDNIYRPYVGEAGTQTITLNAPLKLVQHQKRIGKRSFKNN